MDTFIVKQAIVTLKHAVITGKHAAKAWRLGRVSAEDGCELDKGMFCIADRSEAR